MQTLAGQVILKSSVALSFSFSAPSANGVKLPGRALCLLILYDTLQLDLKSLMSTRTTVPDRWKSTMSTRMTKH